jgi:signal transduction histidine kinase/ActR/RegA family two-component response regulator
MSALRDAPIKRKLYVIILGTAAAVLLLSLLASFAVQITVARDTAGEHLQAMATVLAANSRAAVAFGDREAAAEIVATLATQDEVRWGAIRLPDGELFAVYRSARHRAPAEETAAAEGRWPFLDPMFVEHPVELDGRVLAQLQISADMSLVRDVLLYQTAMAVAVFVLAMLVALLLSARLQRVVSVPVQRLLDAMGSVAATRDFASRAEPLGRDELGRLTEGFNEMLARIRDYDRELAQYRQGLEQQVVRRTEELVQAKEHAVAASLAKSEFLATMSHELRTPLTGVIGFTRLLEKTELDQQQRDYVRIIGSSADNLLEIIDEILDFSKMEAGRIELEPRDFVVADLLEGVVATFQADAQGKGIELSASIAQDLPPLLHGDPLRLRQVLANLVGNAVKFTDHGSVRVRLENAGGGDGELGLRMIVRDTGIGISAAQQALLFRPFQQGDGSITRRFGGTGLGLVIAQRLVRLMDGDIVVSSAPGEGSSFTATVRLGLGQAALPLAPAQPAAPRSGGDTGQAGPAMAGLTVLVVDDSPINLQLASALLIGRGVEVDAVENAADALAAVGRRTYDLVLMDLEMPGMSGIEACRRIRAMPSPAARVPIVAVTAHAYADKRAEAIEAGMDDVLAKPYLPDELYAMIARVCPARGL